MKNRIIKSVVMIFATDFLLLMPLSFFIGNKFMFGFFFIFGFVLLSFILITMVKVLLDEIMD